MNKEKIVTPSRLAIRFLQWVCPSSLYESIEGDLLEQFESDVKSSDHSNWSDDYRLRRAKRRFIWNVICFLRPGILLRNKFSTDLNHIDMLKNYFKISFRSLLKNRIFSFINISGLAIGMAAFLLIVQYVRYEYSYEDFHTNAKNIYRVTLDIYKGSELVVSDCEVYAPIGPILTDKFSEVIDYVRFYESSDKEVKAGDRKFYEERVGFVDPSILTVFSFKMLQGDATTALSAPFQVVITESVAKKYFNRTDVVGEILEIKLHPVKITGVIADPPLNTHLKVSFLISHSTLAKISDYSDTEFQGNNEFTYLLMDDHSDVNVFNDKLKTLSMELKDKIGDDRLVADRMEDIHLYSTKSYGPEANGSARTTNFLFIIAVFILFIAWVNYINLSTARATERAREVGIRKVMGSLRTQLVLQFLTESLIITAVASLIAVLLVYLTLPYFIELSGQPISLSIFQKTEFWYLLTGILIGGSLLAGLYPAFVLSSFRPVAVLKGKFQSSLHGQWLRKTLVVFQFASAITLVICLGTVYSQLQHLKSQDLGMNIEQKLALRAPTLASDSLKIINNESFKAELLKQSLISEVSLTRSLPGTQNVSSTGNVYRPGQENNDRGFIYYINSFDENFIPLFDMKLLAGRNFTNGDTDIIINEEAMNLLGFKNPDEAVGSTVFLYDNEKSVIGVLKNFHQRSPKEKHMPMVCSYGTNADYFVVQIKPEAIEETMEMVSTTWKQMFPDSPLDYFFLDEKFNQQYKLDQQFGKVMSLFSVLAALIACLGLFGLSSFTIVQRTKEIGIRKVLGASVTQIVQLLSQDFVRLVLLAGLVAIPFGYLVMEEWLSGYATRIQLGIWLFIIPSVIILLIALFSVSFQTMKAAQSNPVNTLKSE